MTARNNILARLRAGQTNQVAASSRDELPPLASLPKEQWRSRFMELMTANHADIVETTEQGWQQTLAVELQQRGVKSLLLADRAETDSLKVVLADKTSELTVQVFDSSVEHWEGNSHSMRSQLFSSTDAGLSYASAALAETGSLVLETGPQEPRTLSLVPPLSIIVAREAEMVSGLTEYMAGRAGKTMPTNLLFVSGPSKTADIQQTLAYGAHGPKSLLILWINTAESAAGTELGKGE